MSLDLLPVREEKPPRTLGIGAASLRLGTLSEKIAWARGQGLSGFEVWATGHPRDLYAPSVEPAERERLREELSPFAAIAVQAPTQATYDVSLVSPSAAIRRASVTEVWAACRLAQALGGGVVTVRTGSAPAGVDESRQQVFLSQCLQTLDRVAGDHNAVIGVEVADFFGSGDRLALLEMLSLRHTGITLDTGRVVSARPQEADRPSSGTLGAFIRWCAPRLVHVRLSDFDGEGDRLTPGTVDLAEVAAALDTIDYRGMVCFAFDPALASLKQAAQSIARWKGLRPGARNGL